MEESDLWLFAVVPFLGGVALLDACTHASVSAARQLRLKNPFLIHLAILLLAFAGYVAWFINAFPNFGVIIDYVDVAAYAQKHALRIGVISILQHVDLWLPLGCIFTCGAITAAQKDNILNIFLSLLAGVLGNAGTVVWIIRSRSRAG